MMKIALVVVATAGLALVMSAAPKPIKTASGLVSGAAGRDASITVFKGIPFAAPPVGALRWHAPMPPAAWPGVRAADTFSPSCIQTIVTEKKPWTYEFMAHGEVSEDCLYVNVWTPAAANAKRPVFVYIYGGGNVEGSGSIPAYDGEGLASKGLVVVTFNYRVGVLGFFSHPDLNKESGYNASGNYGLLDQIAALRWVHDNIAAFGGDPARVTVAGQSAGASAVHSLTASPLAKGLFQRAIADSGAGIGGTRTMADQEADGVRFAEAKKAHSIAELRAMPWQEVVTPVQGVRFAPLPDGYALPAIVRDVFASGKQNDVPTLTGINADEGGAVPHPTTTLEAFQRDARQRYGASADAVPQALSGGERRRSEARRERERARSRPRDTLSVGAGPREDRQDAGLHLLLDACPAGTRCRSVRRVSHLRSALRAEHARDVQPSLHAEGSADRRDAVVVLGQLRRGRRPQRQGIGGLARRHHGQGGDDGGRRQLPCDADRRKPGANRILPAIPRG